jgi:hypothetical protein
MHIYCIITIYIYVLFVVDWFFFSRLVYRFVSQRTYECPHSMAPTSVGHFRWFNCNPRLLQIVNNVEAEATRIDVEHGFSIHYVGQSMSKPCSCQSFPTAKRSKKECHPHVYIYIIIYNVNDIYYMIYNIYNHLCTSIIIYTYIWYSKTSSSPWYPIPSPYGRGVKPCSCLWARTRNRFGHGLRRLEELRMVMGIFIFLHIYICICNAMSCNVLECNK